MKITVKTHAELDALVAEKVMRIISIKEFLTATEGTELHTDGVYRTRGTNYSTDIAAAWSVVEKIPDVALFKKHDGWEVNGGKRGSVCANISPTAPLAICLCALASVGIEVELNLATV